MDKYHDMGAWEVFINEQEHPYRIIKRDILKFENDLIRHDANKVRDVMEELINSKD